jgi:hypothetical protein
MKMTLMPVVIRRRKRVQIAVLGFATGLGTTLRSEIAKELLHHVKKKRFNKAYPSKF